MMGAMNYFYFLVAVLGLLAARNIWQARKLTKRYAELLAKKTDPSTEH